VRVIPEIAAFQADLVAWRHDIHAHPELAYEEVRTADLVAGLLEGWGLEVDRGLAKTGVVATLTGGAGPAVALRADMDALPIKETNTFDYRSRHAGKMHACGHDGHTAMLLGAARYLAQRADEVPGTVHFVFQPAEEAAGGARVMVEEGLFERFPAEAVFGMHNWPGLEVGRFAMRPGPMMASLDCFDVTIEGRGTHGALPHHGIDPITTAAAVIQALQTIVSRNVDPLRAVVVSVTKIHAGDAYNVVPPRVELGGGIRSFEPETREFVRARVVEVVEDVARALGATGRVEFGFGNPAVLNEVASTALAARVAGEIVGADRVEANAEPVLGSEDFAFMLEHKPGCYVFIGNGAGEGSCMIHNPGYDFNDEILSLGASYWVRLAQTFLAEHRPARAT
jgi:hippurate hydrolase